MKVSRHFGLVDLIEEEMVVVGLSSEGERPMGVVSVGDLGEGLRCG